MVVGYIIGIVTIPKIVTQETALKLSAAIGLVFTALAFITHGYVSILFVALLGLANSLMWPAIFPMAIRGLGQFTKIGAALLIMGIAGGAIVPQVYARLKDVMSPQSAFFWSMLPCYLYILYYALKGHRVGQREARARIAPATAD
jgi:fucose permease